LFLARLTTQEDTGDLLSSSSLEDNRARNKI
jgi:hypothetical protein